MGASSPSSTTCTWLHTVCSAIPWFFCTSCFLQEHLAWFFHFFFCIIIMQHLLSQATFLPVLQHNFQDLHLVIWPIMFLISSSSSVVPPLSTFCSAKLNLQLHLPAVDSDFSMRSFESSSGANTRMVDIFAFNKQSSYISSIIAGCLWQHSHIFPWNLLHCSSQAVCPI